MSSEGDQEPMYAEESLTRRLHKAQITQQDIQAVAMWILDRRSNMNDIVQVWENHIRATSSGTQQMAALYIANETMQVGSRRYGSHIPKAWEPKLEPVSNYIMEHADERVKRCLMKVVGIWKERKIVDSTLLSALQAIASGHKPQENPVADNQDVEMKPKESKEEKLVAELSSAEATERALENMPILEESSITSTTSKLMQQLVNATINTDLLSDRMFQLESRLTNFHQASDSNQTSMDWEALDPAVFDLDVDNSQEHVQQYRDQLERQMESRSTLLTHLRSLSSFSFFNDDKVYAKNLQELVHQEKELERVYVLCDEAETLEQQRKTEERERLRSTSTPTASRSYSSPGDTYNYPPRPPQRPMQTNRPPPPPFRRHHSFSTSYNPPPRYDDVDSQDGYAPKRPRLEHSQSFGDRRGSFNGYDERSRRWDSPRDRDPPPSYRGYSNRW